MKKSHELAESEQQPSKGFYVLPNLFTTAGLFFGFYSIVASVKGLYEYAAVAIFIAMIADSLDGRVARLTHTTSPFGAEYDSLSDVIAFGVAPALFVYSWGLHHLGKLGWLAAFFYVAATALRLARFNIQGMKSEVSKRYFQGLNCTAAAGCLAGFIWVLEIYGCNGHFTNILAGVVTVLIATLMVSNVRYRSFKDSDFKNKVSFLVILIVVILFVGVALSPPEVLFGIFFTYAVSGPMMAVADLWKHKKDTHE